MATIRKRGFQWEVQIRKRGHAHQFKTFPTRREAEEWASVVQSEMARGVFFSRTEAERTTVAEALDRYLIETGSKKRYPDKEEGFIRRWKAHPLAKRYLATIRGTDLAKYRDDRRMAGRAENTIRIELSYLSCIFEMARKEWGMEGLLNPVRNIRMPSGSNERDRRLKPHEYETLTAELAKSDNPWVLAGFDLAIETSLRQGMLFKLRWDWVDLKSRVILIPLQYRGVGNKAVPAAIPLSTKAVEVLSQLPRAINGMVLGCSQNALMCVWKRTLKRLGYKDGDLHWHDLRHEAASRLFEKGLHPMEVASITGHRNLNTLRRYTHLQASDLARKLG
jgi:integrase